MIVSALTTAIPQNDTFSDNSTIPQTIVPNVLSTSFGSSYNTDAKDNNLSTNTAPITTITSYAMQFKEEETSTHVVQNSTPSDYLALGYFFNESTTGMKPTRTKHILLQNYRVYLIHGPRY